MAELERPVDESDPLRNLYRMSPTAGAATSDYVAINPLAVAAAMLGAGALLAMAFRLLMVAGLAGVVCGIMALRQIRRSNGTQTGLGLAWAGIGLSVVICAGVFGADLLASARLAPERRQMNTILLDLGRHVKAGDYAAAWGLFDPGFQSLMTVDDFRRRWEEIQSPPPAGGGRLTMLEGNNVFDFSAAGESRIALTKALARFEHSPVPGRWPVVFRKQDSGQWRILRIVDLIDPRPAQPRRR